MITPQLVKRLRNVARVLRPWLDTRTYRPLLLLSLVGLGAYLGPPLYDTGVALYFSIPAGIRWAFGEGVFLLIIATGLMRLATVKPADRWPIPPSGQAMEPAVEGSWWVPWALRLAVASLIFPIMRHPDGLGFADWDFVLDKFEALRRTILIWGQFPWWNPWCRGGFPLAAEPQIGAVSIATPLVLALGTATGLRIAAIVYLMIAVEGAYRLALLWLREPWAAAAAALVYGLNGAIIVDTAQGYVTAMSYYIVPWLAYHAFRIGDRFRDGLALGFWLAFAVLNGIHYLSLYGGLLMVAIGMRALRVLPPRERARAVNHTVAGIGVFLALSGWRLATVYPVVCDDRREPMTLWNESLGSALSHLLERPVPDWHITLAGWNFAVYAGLVSYVGLPIVLLALVSLFWGWRWWHTLTLVAGWLAIGSIRWYHASYWLSYWPLFSSAHVVTRWRYVALLGIGLAAGTTLARWRRSGDRRTRVFAAFLTLMVAVDFIALAYQQFPVAFSIRPDAEFFPGPPVASIVNVPDGLGYPCTLRGYGVIRGYEPMLSYRRDAATLRKARDDPEYRGEAWTKGGPVEPACWSPNQLVFQVAPGQEVFVNQNPGSWWRANGKPAFEGRRCAELMVPFAVRADATGRLELEIHPVGLRAGVVLHFVGLTLAVAASSIALATRAAQSRTSRAAEV